ncbi:MAG: hypothetical protein Q9160_002594 [Pyrenula sp. 1 TL-2023]
MFEDRSQDRQQRSKSMPQTQSMSRTITSSSNASSRSGGNKNPLRNLPSTVNHDDPLIYIERTARSLQKHIQRLLDAQSEGLVAGLGGVEGEQYDDAATSGSATPTATPTQSVSKGSTATRQDISASTWSVPNAHKAQPVPVRQPPVKKITLHSARHSLSRSIHDFASLKRSESQILSSKILSRENALERITHYETKETHLREEIFSLENESESATSIHTLRSSERSVAAEIEDLELKLQNLKNRHALLRSQIRERESSLQSTVSSFQGSLSLVQNEIKSFLRRPSIPASTSNSTSAFYALHPQRRTLQLARDCWSEECADLARRKDAAERDRRALVEGERLWSETVEEIGEFEEGMRRKMTYTPESDDRVDNDSRDNEGRQVQEVLRDMDSMIRNLEGKLLHAEDQGWNLLVCALGAELEAFREGRAMLGDAVGIETTSPSSHNADTDADTPHDASHDLLENENENEDPLLHTKLPVRSGPNPTDKPKSLSTSTLASNHQTPSATTPPPPSPPPPPPPLHPPSPNSSNHPPPTPGLASSSDGEDESPPPDLLIDNSSNSHNAPPSPELRNALPELNGVAAAAESEDEDEAEEEGPGMEFLVSRE